MWIEGTMNIFMYARVKQTSNAIVITYDIGTTNFINIKKYFNNVRKIFFSFFST
jgi:hypothetical protein